MRFGVLVLLPQPLTDEVRLECLLQSRLGSRIRNLRVQVLPNGLVLQDLHVNHLAFSRDGKTLVVATENRVRLWDVAAWQERRLADGPAFAATSLGWSPSGKVLASAYGNQLWLWDSARGKVLGQVESGADLLSILNFSADNKVLTTASRDRTLQIRDAATGKVLREIRDEGRQAEKMALSADGKTVAAWGAGTASSIALRDVATGKELRQLEVPTDPPSSRRSTPSSSRATAEPCTRAAATMGPAVTASLSCVGAPPAANCFRASASMMAD